MSEAKTKEDYQVLRVLKNVDAIDPENIDEYVKRGGYEAAKKVVAMNSLEVVEIIKASGLRGRGGAGFPTGLKWEMGNKAQATPKYIICNADEGDPGAYMDREVIEKDPHSVIEGMIIGAYAIGASKGFVYVRAEYNVATKRMKIAVAQAQAMGFLGKAIFGSPFSFDIEIYEGAGAFVCGEETALIASLEGKRGTPRNKPPFPVQRGYRGKPTIINNVETFANIASIVTNGAAWFREAGTEKSPGTKVFSLSGDVKHGGLIEVPMGIPLRDIIFSIGGGVTFGRQFKAVLIGGPSGGCLPESLLDTPVDFESIAPTGAIMGSGGMVVVDNSNCVVDIAKFFIKFTEDESCGKCTSCREGTQALYKILNQISLGKSSLEELELLEETAKNIRDVSLCGLGQTAPNPVLTTLRYFRDEYLEHIQQHWCRAGICKELAIFYIDSQDCIRCGACSRICPSEAITGSKEEPYVIHQKKCVKCRTCVLACKKTHAIKILSKERFAQTMEALQ
jgi:NADH-quinone oxidoreductase subunit F